MFQYKYLKKKIQLAIYDSTTVQIYLIIKNNYKYLLKRFQWQSMLYILFHFILLVLCINTNIQKKVIHVIFQIPLIRSIFNIPT